MKKEVDDEKHEEIDERHLMCKVIDLQSIRLK